MEYGAKLTQSGYTWSHHPIRDQAVQANKSKNNDLYNNISRQRTIISTLHIVTAMFFSFLKGMSHIIFPFKSMQKGGNKIICRKQTKKKKKWYIWHIGFRKEGPPRSEPHLHRLVALETWETQSTLFLIPRILLIKCRNMERQTTNLQRAKTIISLVHAKDV